MPSRDVGTPSHGHRPHLVAVSSDPTFGLDRRLEYLQPFLSPVLPSRGTLAVPFH